MKNQLFAGALLIVCNVAYSQINLGGKPYSFLVASVGGRTEEFAGKEFKMPFVDNAAEQQRATEAQVACNNCQTYYGKAVPLAINVKRDGKSFL